MNRRGAFLPLTLVIFGLAVGCSSDSDPVNNSPAEVSTELNNLSSSLKQHGIDMNGERVTGLKVLSPCENDFLSALKGSMDKIDEIKKKFESNSIARLA